MALCKLVTSKPIETAIREIRDWLGKLGVSGLSVSSVYDARINVAVTKFSYEGKNYEFRSTNQKNCRLNMHAISRVMEYKVRSHLMGIEDFSKSMHAYLQLEMPEGYVSEEGIYRTARKNYDILGISELSSNEEIKNVYRKLCKTFHPDMTNSEEAKEEFTKRIAEINEAYSQIKKEREIK